MIIRQFNLHLRLRIVKPTSLISLPTIHSLCWAWRGVTEDSASQKSLEPLDPLTWVEIYFFFAVLGPFFSFSVNNAQNTDQTFALTSCVGILKSFSPLDLEFKFLFFFFHSSYRPAAALAAPIFGRLVADLVDVGGEELGLGAKLLTRRQQHPLESHQPPLSVPPTSLFSRSFRVEWLPAAL